MGMKISDMKTSDEVHAEDLANDPEYRKEWEGMIEEPKWTVPYWKNVEVVSDGGPEGAMVKVDGEFLPFQRRVVIDSGIDETRITIEMAHPPSGGEIHITGFLITEEQWHAFKNWGPGRQPEGR